MPFKHNLLNQGGSGVDPDPTQRYDERDIYIHNKKNSNNNFCG